MKVANGSKARIPGEVEEISIKVGRMTHLLTCRVVKDALFHLIIGRPAMKNVRASLDFDRHIVTFKSGTMVVTIPLWPDKERDDQALAEEFTVKKKKKILNAQAKMNDMLTTEKMRTLRISSLMFV